MGASPAGPAEPPAPAPPSRRFAPEDVIAAAVPASVPPPAVSPQRPAAAPAIRPRTGDFAPPSKPLGLRPPSAGRASSPSLEGELGGAQTPPPRNVAAAPVAALPTPHPAPVPVPVPASAVASTPTAAERADALREGAAHRAARRPDDLGESRVRQIYNELLEAKRRGNESTASITFDKLHDSLKKQVDKLKKEHTDRRIDFAVVTKDGKAMIKPIIK